MDDTFKWKCYSVEDFFKKFNNTRTNKVNYLNSLFIVSDEKVDNENELRSLLNPGGTLERDQYFFLDITKIDDNNYQINYKHQKEGETYLSDLVMNVSKNIHITFFTMMGRYVTYYGGKSHKHSHKHSRRRSSRRRSSRRRKK